MIVYNNYYSFYCILVFQDNPLDILLIMDYLYTHLMVPVKNIKENRRRHNAYGPCKKQYEQCIRT